MSAIELKDYKTNPNAKIHGIEFVLHSEDRLSITAKNGHFEIYHLNNNVSATYYPNPYGTVSGRMDDNGEITSLSELQERLKENQLSINKVRRMYNSLKYKTK